MTLATTRFADLLQERLDRVTALPSAAELADLFSYTFRASPKSSALLGVLHRYLLSHTLRHARSTTRFYTEATHPDLPAPSDPCQPLDLSAWPVVRRDDVRERFDDLISTGCQFESACHTSGSTGPSLTLYKSSEELAFLWSYYARLMTPVRAALRSTPLTLSFPNLYHGVAIRLPSLARVFVSGATDDTLIRDAMAVLQREYRIPGHDSRISTISGILIHVRLFTSYLLEQGCDLRSMGVRSLNVVGEYMTPAARRFLADAWGATVFDRFTLTESVGGAYRCLTCDHFHLDPHVIGEVVDVDTGAAAAGVGELVLTQLHPFVQMQPLLRYWTGDVVRRVPSHCAPTLTFDFLGKASNCVRRPHEGRTEWLLYSAVLRDVLEEIPDVRLHDTFPNVTAVHDTTFASPPVFRLATSQETADRLVIELTVELRYAPYGFDGRLREIDSTIRTHLTSSIPDLANRLKDGTVRLDIGFSPPGGLGDSFAIKT